MRKNEIMSETEFGDYISDMKNNSSWGDGIMLSAAAEMYKRPVHVWTAEGSQKVIRVDTSMETDAEPIRLGYPGTHYASVNSTPQAMSEIKQCQYEVIASGNSISSTSDSSKPAMTVVSDKKLENNEIKNTELSEGEGVHVLSRDIGDLVSPNGLVSVDDFTKCQILLNPWQPPKDYQFPFSEHKKKGKLEKRYLNASHLAGEYASSWVVFSPKLQGLYCKYCPFFVASQCGGSRKTVPLKKFVTQPVTMFAKLLGEDGDFKTHCTNQYHIDAVAAGKSFLNAYQNPAESIINQMSSQRLAQVTENRDRIKPIVESIVFMGRQNIPLRGHRDDGSILDQPEDLSKNEENFRELLRYRIAAGDTKLENHLKTAGARATYVSKTSQNNLIDCCEEEILATILARVQEARFFSVVFDETTDISHTSQMSVVLRYLHDGFVREDFVGFVDPHSMNYSLEENDTSEPVLNGQILGQTVIQVLQDFGLDLDDCVGIGTDDCSVMVSKQRGAVAEIQKKGEQCRSMSMFQPCIKPGCVKIIKRSVSVTSLEF